MKKIITIIISMLIAILPMVGCTNKVTPKLELSHDEISLSMFGETEIIADLSGATDIAWENSNEDVIKMIVKGKSVNVIAKGVGTATITAKSSGITDSCVISVAKTTEKLLLSINHHDLLELRVGGTGYIPTTVSFGGNEFAKAKISFEVEDTEIATVDENGVVTAKGVGTTYVKVFAEYEGNYSNVCSVAVVVTSGPLVNVNVAYAELYYAEGVMDQNLFPQYKDLSISIIDNNNVVAVEDFTVENSNEDVAKLEDGKIVAVSAGETQIKITCNYSGNEYTATIYVTVDNIPQVSLFLTKTSLKLVSKGYTSAHIAQEQLGVVATLDGRSISNSDLYWTVDSGSDIVSVNEKGVVSALTAGKATVSANYDFAGKTYKATCDVTVDDVLFYGQHERYGYDGIISKVDQGVSLVCAGLDFENSATKPLIRVQYIPPVEYTADKGTVNGGSTVDTAPNGPDMFYVTIQDAEDLGSYVTFGVRRYKGDGAFYPSSRVGARASTWGGYTTGGSNANSFYGYFNTDNDPAHWGVPMGINGGYATGASFSFYGAHLNNTVNHENYMIGFSLDGSKVYMHNNGTSTLLWDFDAGSDGANRAKWSGISSSKVNIFISTDYYQNNYNYCYFMIDMLAGESVTNSSLELFNFGTINGGVIPDPA